MGRVVPSFVPEAGGGESGVAEPVRKVVPGREHDAVGSQLFGVGGQGTDILPIVPRTDHRIEALLHEDGGRNVEIVPIPVLPVRHDDPAVEQIEGGRRIPVVPVGHNGAFPEIGPAQELIVPDDGAASRFADVLRQPVQEFSQQFVRHPLPASVAGGDPDDPNEEDPKVKERTEKKLKEFREYIVDKGVVLMFVKVLLSLKYAENKPRNPIKIIRDYFGKYHDPRWDEMSALKEKIILFNNENAKLLEKAMNLEDELKNLKRSKRIDKLFNSFELDKNGLIGSKYIIEILTGNKKFDVDEKFDKDGLIKFIESTVETHSDDENKLLESLESALQGNQVFKEDLENPIYLKIVEYFKGLKEANKENKKNEKK